ncbi:hypothetical protein UO65_2421 [Actinokineospora spheciospongiae]|uniref:DNA-binding protein n=1 Tax=Actinokineospora spheciospongiae TaxID=909613 RepID=W7IZX8_9PSEU|nr:hypothetical protein [Actinokineospora spheciospongiae]EWC62242.1 hypothetical protein UO65_2421 [Actinokineospora spheciospongiae]
MNTSENTLDPRVDAALLAAGAILPGTSAAGPDRDTVTARRYTHPALDDRVVVRLVPEVLGRAEDLTCEYLGFDAPVRAEGVGTGRRSALGFPAWALVNDPANAHHALNLVKDVERLARTAKSKASAAKDGFTALGDMLGRSAPHFLPTFYEQAGRIFLEHANPTYAATMFGKAREAEEVHDLAVDAERTREVFLEFAFAGALTAKALSAHAKGLARKHDPGAAHELFLTLCVERTRGGLPPYTGMPEDLRRLARAAGRDVAAEDERLLRAILDSPAIKGAGAAFWKSHRDTLVAMATADARVRSQLLAFVPSAASARPTLDLWLDLLSACGADRALVEPGAGAAPTPAAWLSTVLGVRGSGYGTGSGRSERLLELITAMADRLVADAEPVRVLRGWRQGELDVLDLMVARGIPVAEGDRDTPRLDVGGWLGDDGPGRRDLVALAGSERFVGPLGEGFVQHARSAARSGAVSREALLPVLAVPGLRAALRHWLTARAAETAATGLPGLAERLQAVAVLRLPEAFADVPEAAEAIAATDVAAALRATLHAGLLDELGWPALEDAVARLTAASAAPNEGVVVCGEGWPALVLRRGESFVVVGPDGVLAEHLSRIPTERRHRWAFAPTALWCDGVLLVRWQTDDGESAYWSDAPDRVFDPGEHTAHYGRDLPAPSIALTGGGRGTGGRAVHPGDTQAPRSGRVFGDGTTLWTDRYSDGEWRWVELDPATGERGRASLPRFVEDFALDGAALQPQWCDLRPVAAATSMSPLGAAGGLHGWRVRREADGSWTGEGVDGRRARLTGGREGPAGVLRLPGGGEVVLSRRQGHLMLHATDGSALGAVSASDRHPAYAAGTPFVAPVEWWHLLTPRDPAGSAALREVGREAVERVLEAALAEPADDARRPADEVFADLVAGKRGGLAGAVADALPGLTHPALLAGVLDVVRRAAGLLREHRGYAPIADAARRVDTALFAPVGPVVTEEDLNAALSWFGTYRSHRGHGSVPTNLPDLLTALGETAAEPTPAAGALPESTSPDWYDVLPHAAALAHRAASPFTPDAQREALVLFLRSVAAAGLVDGTGHWRTVGLLVPNGSPDPKTRVVPVDGGFVAVFEQQWRHDADNRFDGVQYTRTPGVFDLPRGWRVEAAEEVRPSFGPDRVAAFLTALAERGPAPWLPEAVLALVERTGMGIAEATVLLAGMPGVDRWDAHYLSTEERRALGLSAGAAKAAKETLRPLTDSFRRALLAAAVPTDPADLWTTGPDVDAVAEVWTAKFGRRTPVPDDVLVDATKLLPLHNSGEYVTGVLNPGLTPWLAASQGVRVDEQGASVVDNPGGFDRSTLRAVPQVLLWLAQRLPAGSPLRARLPEALDLARRRVADPGFAVELTHWADNDQLRALLGLDGPDDELFGTHRGWLEVGRYRDERSRLVVRPGLIGPQDRDLFTALAEVWYCGDLVTAADLLASAGLAAACAATAAEGTDPAAYFQDPAVSAPHLVAEVAGKFGLAEDAAVLYLQLLALPDPTDANTARWTGWKPARLRKARAALAETDLVLTAKRARAGRSLFLPGGWLPLGAPHLPLETWKAPMFGITGKPDSAIVAREPAADLFTRAWRRVLDGDAPAYEELKTGGRR